MEKLVSIRGAISVKENSSASIKEGVLELLREIVRKNKLDNENIVNIIFTVTHDLDAIHPATVAREDLNFSNMPMLCTQEMKITKDLPRCIRVLVQAYTSSSKESIKHIYLREASKLRPDLCSEK